MSEIISQADMSDESVRRQIVKNERIARECIALMVKRFRKDSPEKNFENTLNVAGIICAELIRDANDIGGENLAQATADLFAQHSSRAMALLDVKGGPQ